MNTFKKFLRLAGCVLVVPMLLASAPLAQADNSFTGFGTASGATNSYYLIKSTLGGVPSVYGFDSTIQGSDITNQVLNTVQFRFLTGTVPSGTALTGSTTNLGYLLYTSTTNQFAAGDTVVVRQKRTDQHQVFRVVSVTNAANGPALVVTPALTFALTNGPSADVFWKLTNGGSYAYTYQLPYSIANATNMLAAKWAKDSTMFPLFTGFADCPAVVELIGTKTNTLNVVVGRGVKEQQQAK